MPHQDLAATIKRLSEGVPSTLTADTIKKLEHLSIKDLRQYTATSGPGIVNPMTEKASVVSVVIWIIIADAPGEEEIRER